MSSFHCAECKGFIVTALMFLRFQGGGGLDDAPPPLAHELNKSPGIIGLSRSRAEFNSLLLYFFLRNTGGYSRTGSGCYTLNSLWTSGIWTTCEHHKLIK